MMFGQIETLAERIEHLQRLRELQDRTGGFTAFICWTFQAENTALGGSEATAAEYLRTLAVSRIYLDNFPHLKAFWIMLGVKLAQVALSFGADDLDGTVAEERITHAAGATTPQAMTVAELRALIEEAGRTPVERTTLYEVVEREPNR